MTGHIPFKSMKIELDDGTVIDVDPGKIVDAQTSFSDDFSEVEVVVIFRAPRVHFNYGDGMRAEMGFLNHGFKIVKSPPPELNDAL